MFAKMGQGVGRWRALRSLWRAWEICEEGFLGEGWEILQVGLGRSLEYLRLKEGGNWDGGSPGVLAAHRPHWGLHVCLLQAARGPRGLKGEKGEPAVLEPVSHCWSLS